MRYATTIGIDAHTKTNEIAAIIDKTGELRRTKLPADPQVLIKWIKDQEFPTPIHCVYESGPTGFGLARELNEARIDCDMIAVSKMPKPSDRVKTDKRDALFLARQSLAGTLRAVYIPTHREESLRSLSRQRQHLSNELAKEKQRVRSFMLVRRVLYTKTKKYWTKTFFAWANTFEFAEIADTITFKSMIAHIHFLELQIEALVDKLKEIISEDEYLSELMKRFKCIHGIGDIVALTLVCEIGDFTRFKSPGAFASYIGVTSSEDSSGDTEKKGRITKLGNAYVRYVLCEVANTYARHTLSITQTYDADTDPYFSQKGYEYSLYLRKKMVKLKDRGKHTNVAKVAVVRQLACFLYHLAVA